MGVLDKVKAVFLAAVAGSQAGHPKATTVVVRVVKEGSSDRADGVSCRRVRVKGNWSQVQIGAGRAKAASSAAAGRAGRGQWQLWRAKHRSPWRERACKCRGGWWSRVGKQVSQTESKARRKGRARPAFHRQTGGSKQNPWPGAGVVANQRNLPN